MTTREFRPDPKTGLTLELVPCPSCSGDVMRRQRFAAFRRLMEEARVPPLFAQMDFSTFPVTPEKAEAVKTVATWSRSPGGLWLYLFGPVGCVAGETLIALPGVGSERIDVLARRAQSITVWALTPEGPVAAPASAPFLKGYAPLYRVSLSDGRSITTTAHHRFLTPDGWLRLDQLAVGSHLGCALRPPVSSSGNGPARSRGDVPRSLRRFGDSTGRYSACLRLNGGPLRSVAGDDRVFAPCSGDVPGHSPDYWRSGALAAESAHSHHCLSSALPAMIDSARPVARPVALAEYRFAASHSERLSSPHPGSPRFPATCSPPRGVSGCGQSEDRADESALIAPFTTYCTISGISPIGSGLFYDMHVPTYENYLAQGFWNHNTGKTGLAVAALKARVQMGQPALFWSLPDLLLRIRATFGNDGNGTEQQLMAALSDAEVLVLDDLGTEKVSDWQQQVLFQIVNGRILHQRDTIVTSNLPPDRLAPQVGERTADRIESIALPVRVAGVNLRHVPRQREAVSNA